MLTRLFVIQVLFYGITGVMTAILHSLRRFLAAAWAPVASNVIIIATLLTLPGAGSTTWRLSDVTTNTRFFLTLGLGATGGIALMALITTVAVFRAKVGLKWHVDLRHPAVARVARMSGWTLGFVVANQVALVVIRNLADPGSSLASAYFDAFIFFVLPHGLLAVSIATTLQPELARAVAQEQGERFTRLLAGGIRAIVALTAPASAALLVVGPLAITSLMQRGQFDATSAQNTSDALSGLAIGLIGFSTYLFILRGFYAHGDTRTPFFLNVGENGLNVVLAVILVGPFGVFGLGLSLGIAYLVAAAVSLIILRQRRAYSSRHCTYPRHRRALGVGRHRRLLYLALDVRTERVFLARNRRHLRCFCTFSCALCGLHRLHKSIQGRLEEPESTRRVAHRGSTTRSSRWTTS